MTDVWPHGATICIISTRYDRHPFGEQITQTNHPKEAPLEIVETSQVLLRTSEVMQSQRFGSFLWTGHETSRQLPSFSSNLALHFCYRASRTPRPRRKATARKTKDRSSGDSQKKSKNARDSTKEPAIRPDLPPLATHRLRRPLNRGSQSIFVFFRTPGSRLYLF